MRLLHERRYDEKLNRFVEEYWLALDGERVMPDEAKAADAAIRECRSMREKRGD